MPRDRFGQLEFLRLLRHGDRGPLTLTGWGLNLFVALPLPDALKAELAAWPQPPVRATWAGSGGLHLTLAFLGPLPESDHHALAGVLAACAAGHEAFPLRTSRLGGFPSLERARVLWLGVEDAPRLRALAADLRHRLAAAGLPFDAKPFTPHITLARMKVPSDLGWAPSPPAQDFAADRIVLYRSRRLPEGARYEVVAEAPLLASSPRGGAP